MVTTTMTVDEIIGSREFVEMRRMYHELCGPNGAFGSRDAFFTWMERYFDMATRAQTTRELGEIFRVGGHAEVALRQLAQLEDGRESRVARELILVPLRLFSRLCQTARWAMTVEADIPTPNLPKAKPGETAPSKFAAARYDFIEPLADSFRLLEIACTGLDAH